MQGPRKQGTLIHTHSHTCARANPTVRTAIDWSRRLPFIERGRERGRGRGGSRGSWLSIDRWNVERALFSNIFRASEKSTRFVVATFENSRAFQSSVFNTAWPTSQTDPDKKAFQQSRSSAQRLPSLATRHQIPSLASVARFSGECHSQWPDAVIQRSELMTENALQANKRKRKSYRPTFQLQNM